MTNPNFADEEDDKPLDPAMEKLRRKMVRLLFISSAAIVLALMAVLGSIVYKASKKTQPADSAAAQPAANVTLPQNQTIAVPVGFVVEQSSLEGARLLLTGKTGDGRSRIYVYDVITGKRLSDIEIAPQ